MRREIADGTVIDVRDAPPRERYEITLDGTVVGFAAYHRRPGRISLLHTEVDEAFEHRGLASRLIAYALDDARATGTEVLPTCPFVRAFIGEHPEYKELVPTDDRKRFAL